jgi:hypothetical protein
VELALPYPPAPEYMAGHAADIVAMALEVDGVDLDFTVRSLDDVDRVLGRFHDAGDDPERMAETLFRFGAYIGEVIVYRASGSWVTLPDDHPMGGWPVVALPSGDLVNPVGRAFKRVRNGPPDSITHFYKALVLRR